MAFRKPEAHKVGIKVLIWGKKGVGKSRFLLTFPSIAVIDAETGLAFYEGKDIGKNLKLVSNTQSFKELEDDMDTIREDHKELGIETFAIDSETKVYENIQETVMAVEEKRARRNSRDIDDTNLSQRSWGRIKYVSKKLQNLKIDLSGAGINLVSVAQYDDVKEKKGDQFVVVGGKPVMAKNAEHDYDLVLYMYTEKDSRGKVQYKARVDKDRTDTYKEGDIIESPTYDLWKNEVENLSKNKALNTTFAKEQDDVKDEYAKELDNEEKSIGERLKDLVLKSDDATKEEIKEALSKAKIAKFEGLTAKKQAELEEIYKKFSK